MGDSISSSIGPPSRELEAAFTCCQVVAEDLVEAVVEAAVEAAVVTVVAVVVVFVCLPEAKCCLRHVWPNVCWGKGSPHRSLLIPVQGSPPMPDLPQPWTL